MKTFIRILCLALAESVQEIHVRHPLIHRNHLLGDIVLKEMSDVLLMRRWNLVLCDGTLIEAHGVFSCRASVMLRIFIC